MEKSAVIFTIFLAVFFVIISGLVAYLLYRKKPKDSKKLRPQKTVAISYGDSSPTNGKLALDNKNGKGRPTSSSISSSEKSEKVIEIPKSSLYEEVSTTVIVVEGEPASEQDENVIEGPNERKLSSTYSSNSSDDEKNRSLQQKENDIEKIPVYATLLGSEKKNRTYVEEKVVGGKKKDVDVELEVSSTSSEDDMANTTMISETSIPISSKTKFRPFRTTIPVEKQSQESSSSSSTSSSSSENEEEKNLRSEVNTQLIVPKVETVITEIVTIEEKQEMFYSTTVDGDESISVNFEPLENSSSSSSDSENNFVATKKTSQKSISFGNRSNEYDKENILTTKTINTITEKKKKSRKNIKFTSGWKRQVTLDDLLKAGVVSAITVENLEHGHIGEDDVAKSIQIYLVGEEPIAGLLMSDTGEKMSIYNAWKNGLIRRGTSISLLEAQAATGRIIDPVTAEKMSVREATERLLIDHQLEAVLLRAERAVYGYKTRLSNQILSLFEAMNQGLVVENHGIRLLEAQIATGGIIDPNVNHRLPVEVAFERGLFDKHLNDILEDPTDDTRGFFDPNTEENLTYLELMKRCVIDKDTGLRLLPLQTRRVESSAKTSKVVFETVNKRKVYIQDIIDAELVDLSTARKFEYGEMSSKELRSMVAKLKVYVDGTMPIAGIINSTTGEKLSIIEAFKAELLRKGTAYELLEAQAACGKIIDMQTAKSISPKTAINMGIIEKDFEDCVYRASRAVIGYREPFTKEVLSLCEAMSRHLVVDRQAIRLLEAQIATGGIIELKSPVRISVSLALKRGLLDYHLAKKLENRETTSYFDPVTGENLNYSELMGRCVLDKDSNLLFLMVEGKTVTQNIRPFEPDPDSMKIRERASAKITTEIVETKTRSYSSLEKSSCETSSLCRIVPSSPPAILSRRVVIIDPTTEKELTVKEALENKLIDENTANQLLAQEGDFEE